MSKIVYILGFLAQTVNKGDRFIRLLHQKFWQPVAKIWKSLGPLGLLLTILMGDKLQCRIIVKILQFSLLQVLQVKYHDDASLMHHHYLPSLLFSRPSVSRLLRITLASPLRVTVATIQRGVVYAVEPIMGLEGKCVMRQEE